jgi:outer membrane protein assembly factor BamB
MRPMRWNIKVVFVAMRRRGLFVLGWIVCLQALAGSILISGVSAGPNGGDWPSFRGDGQLRGVAEGSLPDRPVLLWRFTTGGAVLSTAAIDSGRVFIGSSDSKLYALDLRTGQRLWDYSTGDSVEAPPLVLDNRVYVGSADTYLYCLDADSGDLHWKFKSEDKILGAANYADTETTAGTVVIFGSYDGNLYGVSARTGKRMWTYSIDNFINGAPAIAGGQAVFGGCDGLIHIVSVEDGKKLGQIPVGSYIAGTIAIDQGQAYIGHYDNVFLCADLAEQKILWEYKDRAFPFFSSAAVATDRIVFGGRDKYLHCVDRNTGKRRWNFKTGGKIDGSPVICGGRVVVGSGDGKLYIIDLEAGELIWSYEIGESLFSSPAVADQVIVIGSQDGVVYAFGPEERKPSHQQARGR